MTAPHPPMTLWRLERLRLVRTRRLVGLAAVYLFFGATSPPLARYLPQIIEHTGGTSVTIVAPPAQPLDGIGGYGSNAAQIGLLAFTFVVAASLAFDSQREMAVFLRTRTPRYRDLLIPRYVTSVGAGIACFSFGALVAWAGTAGWIGGLDAAGVVAGIGCGAAYLAFVGAVAAAWAARLSSTVATAVATLAVALALGLVGAVGRPGEWLPSDLLGALGPLAVGGDPADHVRALGVTVAATAGLLALAVRWGARREV